MNAKVDVTVVELDDASYLSAYCPNPKMALWASHPRIFLDFSNNGEARCPYCSTIYRLKPGVAAKGHH
jgi:uncharacterized Zn-finger protein